MTIVRSSVCVLCSSPSRYTCPRCSLHTCSVQCSRSHKLKFSCTGERDPAEFINLRDVGPRIWAEDYRWLEEGRRRIAAWGQGLPSSSEGRREGQNGKRGQGAQSGRMDGLRAELRKRGCLVDFMPFGMRRKQLNQSTWYSNTRTMWLTIQLVMPVALPRPMDPISTETRTVRHSRVLIVSPDEKHLPTLASLLPPPLSAEAIVFVLPFHQAQTQPPPAKPPGKAFFPPLAPTRPLEHALKGTAWVEFPIIHVIPLVEWDEAVHKGEITIMSLYEPMLEEPAERPRDNGWGSKRRASLGESGPAREPVTKKVKMAPDLGLAALGEYKSADEENESADEENESEDGEKGEKMEVSKKRKEARVDGKDGVADGKVGLVHEESEVEDVDVHLNDDVDLHREDIRLDDGFGLEYGPRELGDDENGGGNDDADGLEVGEDGLIED